MLNNPEVMYQQQWAMPGNASLNMQMPMQNVMQGTGMVDEYLDFPQKPAENALEDRPKAVKSGTRPNSSAFAKKWRGRLVRAKDGRKSWERESRFNYGLYFNKSRAWAKAVTIKGYAQPLAIFTNPVALNVDTDRDRMLPKNPSFKVWPKVKYTYFQNPQDPEGTPGKRDNVVAARMYQEVANMLALELDLRKTIKRAITDSLVTNVGVVKIAWDTIGQLSHGSPHIEGEGNRVLGEGEIVSSPNSELARPNFPWCVHVPWDRIILDPTAGTMEQVNWIAERVIVPKAGMETKLPKMSEATGDKINKFANVATGSEEDEDGEYDLRDDEEQTPDIEMVEYWEVHYREVDPAADAGFRYFTFDLFEGDGGACRNHREYDRDIGGFCYEMLQFKEIVGDLLGYSQIRLYASSAAHANLTKQLQLDYAIRALPFLLADSGLDKKVVDAICNGTVAKLVKANTQAKDKIIPIVLPALNQDLANAIGIADRSSDQMSGRSVNDRLQGGVSTATEAKVIANNSAELTLATVDVLRIFAARVIKKCVRVFASLLDAEQTYQVPDRKGGFLVFEQQNLCCDIAIELDWQSTVRKDDAVERKLNMDLLTVLVQAKASGMVPNINLEPVLKKIVVSSGFDDPGEIFVNQEADPSDPDTEHMLILAGEPVEPSNEEDLAKNYQAHVQFAAVCMGADPQVTALWASQPGAVQRLLDHITKTAALMAASGMAMEGGALPGKAPSGGSGAQFNRPSQGVPNAGDMQASASRVGSNPGGTGPGRLGGM